MRQQVDSFIYHLDGLLIARGHQCNVTLTEHRPRVFSFQGKCIYCAMDFNYRFESIERLYQRLDELRQCK